MMMLLKNNDTLITDNCELFGLDFISAAVYAK